MISRRKFLAGAVAAAVTPTVAPTELALSEESIVNFFGSLQGMRETLFIQPNTIIIRDPMRAVVRFSVVGEPNVWWEQE